MIDEIIPYSLEYYLGVKTGEDYNDIEFGDEHSHEDSEDDGDDAEEGAKPNNKKKAHKKSTDSTKSKGSNNNTKEEKPECKSQWKAILNN